MGARADVEVSEAKLVGARSNQTDTVVASNGRDFLAVWLDHLDVRAMRVRGDGIPIDSSSLRINETWGCFTPHASWNGSTYLIAFERSHQSFIRALTPTGELGPERPLHSGTFPRLASSPVGSIAVGRGINGVRIFVLARDGTSVAGANIPTLMFDGPLVTPFGDNFLVAWNESRAVPGGVVISGAVVSPKGQVVSGPRILSESGGWLRSIAAIGETAIIIYREIGGDTYQNGWRSTELRARIVTPSSVSAQLVIASSGDDHAIYDAAATAHSGEFFVTWMQKVAIIDTRGPAVAILPSPFVPTYDLHSARVRTDGTVVERAALTEGPDSDEYPAIGSNGRNLLASWVERSILRRRQSVTAALIDGSTSLRVNVGRSAPAQRDPQVVTDRDLQLVVWEEEPKNDGRISIHARRMNLSGQFLDPEPLVMAIERDPVTQPSVATNGREFLIVWTDRRNERVLARRVTRDGLIRDLYPLDIGPTAGDPLAVASDGERFLIVNRSGGEYPIAVLDESGNLRRSRRPPGFVGVGQARVTWNGSRYFLVWSVSGKVSGVWLNRDGEPGSANEFIIAEKTAYDAQAAVGCTAESCVVGWFGGEFIGAARVIGEVVAPLGALGSLSSRKPDVAVTADGFVLSWTTYQNPGYCLSSVTIPEFGSPGDAKCLVAVAQGPLTADVATTSSDDVVVAYQVPIEGAAYGGSPRVLVRSSADDQRRRAVRR